eukprot:7343616-Lingulodinium_polyedra.AAC.1
MCVTSGSIQGSVRSLDDIGQMMAVLHNACNRFVLRYLGQCAKAVTTIGAMLTTQRRPLSPYML